MSRWASSPYWQKALFGTVMLVGSLTSLNLITIAETTYGLDMPIVTILLLTPLVVYTLVGIGMTTYAAYMSFVLGEKQRAVALLPLIITVVVLAGVATSLNQYTASIVIDLPLG